MTLLTDSTYLPCIIRQNQRLQHLKTKYPYIVLVSENIFNDISLELSKNNILYYIIPRYQFSQKTLTYSDTINKFQTLCYQNFEKICFIDADVIFFKNLDYLFEKIKFNNYSIIGFLENIEHKKITGGIFFTTFNLLLWKYILNLSFLENFHHDEEILNFLLTKNLLKQSNLDQKEFKILHFAGEHKLWKINSNFAKKFFFEISAQDFNFLMDYNINELFAIEGCLSKSSIYIHKLYDSFENYKIFLKEDN